MTGGRAASSEAVPSGRPRMLGPALWVLTGALLALAWWAPDLLSRWRATSGPYAEMPAGCDPTEGPCVATFEDGAQVRLEVKTSTLAERRRAFEFTVRANAPEPPETVDLSGINMMSGLFRLPLEREGEVWRASTHLPRCTMKKMLWRAEVGLGDRTASFAFASFNPEGRR